MGAAAAPPASPALGAPRSRLPLAYFAFAHLCLLAAFLLLAVFPMSFAGFFYHPRMLAAVHLVTLGWISASILGSLYIVCPLVLRAPLVVGRWDHAAFWAFAIGATGMPAHFWIDEPRGMLGAALLVVAALAAVGLRTARALRRSPLDLGVRLHVDLAFANVLVAGSWGILMGLDKLAPALPGHVLSNVFAHAHLAALGWATMMVAGAGHRLLPMLLPSALPSPRAALASAFLLEAGALALFAGILLGGPLLRAGALAGGAAVAFFLWRVLWMRRNPRPAPPHRPEPDLANLHAAQAVDRRGAPARRRLRS